MKVYHFCLKRYLLPLNISLHNNLSLRVDQYICYKLNKYKSDNYSEFV